MLSALLVVALAAIAAGIAALVWADRRHREAAALASIASRASIILSESLNPREVVGDVLRLFIPRFADWAIVHLLDGEDVRRVSVAHVDPRIEREIEATLDFPFDHGPRHGPAKVMRTGVAEFISDTASALEGAGSETKRVLELAGIGCALCVPLQARQRTIGSLTLARRRPDACRPADLPWIEDLARRIALALENARLTQEARELFEQTISANFVSTPDGRLLACNQAFARLLGVETVGDALRLHASSLYPTPADRERALDALRQHKRLVGFETTIVRRDGRHVAVSENAVGTFNQRGELTRITGFVLDVSAQKALEAQLRQAQRLEAVGQLAGGIAHDFNNLLTIILGCVELLKRGRTTPPAGTSDPLDELDRAAQRAAALTQQLLAFSRRQVLQPRIVDVNDALRAVHPMLRRLVREKVVIVLDLAPKLSRVRVDPGQLDQVVMNLVANAGDAMAGGGTVTLATANAALTEEDVATHRYVTPGTYVRLTVTDTGIGMDEATVARVFEPFFTTKPEGKGTGLGLSTVYGIVKQSGGYVWVTSAPGAGTTVSVYLPSQEA
jgi:PAS domain S-box-containing protein